MEGFGRTKETNLNRSAGLDIARIIAMIAVIILHSTQNSSAKILVSFCVLLFVMVSGALWLDESRKIVVPKLIKSILRIVAAFIFWSLIYTMVAPEMTGIYGFIRQTIIGPYHFWYCYMIVGLYLILPFLKVLQSNKSIFRYFFLISFITAIIFPTLSSVNSLSGFMEIVSGIRVYIGIGYVFYFLLGYFLSNCRFPVIIRILYCCVGIGSGISLFFFDAGGDFSLFKMFYASGIFILSIEIGKLIKSDRIKSILTFISKQCFTVYLIHVLIIMLIGDYIRDYINSDFAYCIIIIIVCFVLASVLNLLLKYILKIFWKGTKL